MNNKDKLEKEFFNLHQRLWAMMLAIGLVLGICSWSCSNANAELEVALSTDKKIYNSGEAIVLKLRLQNLDRKPITLTFSSSQKYDFWVRNQSGTEVWRWSAGKYFLDVMGYWVIQGGDEIWFQETWEQKDNLGATIPPGDYIVHACVPASPIADKICTATLTIR